MCQIRPKKQRRSAALSVMKIRQKLCKMGYLLIKWDGFACWKPIGAPIYPVGVVFHKLCKALLEANFLLVWVQHFLLLSQFYYFHNFQSIDEAALTKRHWRSGIDEAALMKRHWQSGIDKAALTKRQRQDLGRPICQFCGTECLVSSFEAEKLKEK